MTHRVSGRESADRTGGRTRCDDFAVRLATLEQAPWMQLLRPLPRPLLRPRRLALPYQELVLLAVRPVHADATARPS